MRIGKFRTVAAFLAVPLSLIGTSIVLVSAFSTPVDVAGKPRQPAVLAATPAAAPVASPRRGPDRHANAAATTSQGSASRDTMDEPGNVEAVQQVDILPAVSGRLGRLAVDIGSSVRRGDVLADLEAPELILDLARTEAVVRQARARIAAARSDVVAAESSVNSARARMESAEAAWRAADASQTYRKRQHARIVQLIEKGALAPTVRQEEEDRLRAKESEVSTSRSQFAVAQADLQCAQARSQSARADSEEVDEGLRIAAADRDKARLLVDSLRIRSPIDGVVSRRNVGVGEFVRVAAGVGAKPILTVVQMRSVRVVTNVPDRDVRRVDVGDPVTFRTDDPGARVFRGQVSRIAVAEDPSTRTMRAEIDLENADGFLRPGQGGRVQIELDTQPESISMPRTAAERSTRGAS
jgi:HlyD family secretion protein